MSRFYSDLYKDHYARIPYTLAPSLETVRSDLDDCGYGERIDGLSVLTCGTGRESMVLADAGAEVIHHVDIATAAIRSAEAVGPVVRGHNRDLCDSDLLPELSSTVDLVYLNGILQHLHTPARALSNAARFLKMGGKLVIRIYRSGALNWFVTQMTRPMVDWSDIDVLAVLAEELDAGEWFLSDMLDDLYVPILRIACPNCLVEIAAALGMALESVDYDYKIFYDHGRVDPLARFCFVKVAEPSSRVRALHLVDQMLDIDYSPDFVHRTCELVADLHDRRFSMTSQVRCEFVARAHAIGLRPESDPALNHARLQQECLRAMM